MVPPRVPFPRPAAKGGATDAQESHTAEIQGRLRGAERNRGRASTGTVDSIVDMLTG